MTDKLNTAAKTLADIVKEQGLAVVLCCVLIGFVLWTSYTQQQREDARVFATEKRASEALVAQRLQTAEILTVVSGNTAAMQSMADASVINTAAVDGLRMELMKK